MSWLSALSVGSAGQNIAVYLLLALLAYVNYGLIRANRRRKCFALLVPGRKITAGDGLENELEQMTDAVYTVDPDWNFTFINKAYESLQGRDRNKLLGKNVWELFPYGKERCYFREYERVLREQVCVHFEEFNPFNGMWVSARAYPIQSGLAVCFRDITAEKLKRLGGEP